ncbi:unnamed protein product [Candidula unifasciata]|uniref:Uncharacterized protein n=1 Tax=Candidula unifasciata TaxID=100452 RepID=A0A8S3YI33_9EUPU|nr:unnamed protein product [Candidula unifasciata]
MYLHYQITRLARDQKNHLTRRLCRDSNWPFTGDLSSDEMVCMLDSYFGKRRTPSCIPPRCPYDRLYHNTIGWNQSAIKDTRQNFKECQFSANQEDKQRSVVVCANATYGHYLDRFTDFMFKDHGRVQTCKAFYSHGKISTLPPIEDLNHTHDS